MTKFAAYLCTLGLSVLTFCYLPCAATPVFKHAQSHDFSKLACMGRDTLVPQDILEVVTSVVNAVTSFNLQTVAEIYTPNAVIADDEPPYSWNGPTAGIQWVNAVEKACKVNSLTRLTSKVLPINVFQQSVENVYVVVPVTFTGKLPGKQLFEVNGAFTFILRQVNGKWMIKSQTWMQKKGVE